MKKLPLFLLFASLVGVAACSHSTFGRLVGSDRDDHGCIGSAGYTWSNALHDCVRVWEVGERFEEGQQQLFLVFSTDSTYAEIFTTDKDPVLCHRVKETNAWQPSKGKERVFINNDVITVKTSNYTFTKSVR